VQRGDLFFIDWENAAEVRGDLAAGGQHVVRKGRERMLADGRIGVAFMTPCWLR
jgi:hypothetical protein